MIRKGRFVVKKGKRQDIDDDMFSTFLVKEQELAYVEKRHAQAAIIQMSDGFRKREEQATIKTKIMDFFQDIKDTRELKRLKKESEIKLSQLSDEEKCNKEIEHKEYIHGNFKTHFFFEQKYTERNIIADCGGIHFPVMEYNVYIRIEYSVAEIWTGKHFELTTDDYEKAKTYYNELKTNYKNKSAKNIIEYLTKKIDNHCEELNTRISSFDCKDLYEKLESLNSY